MTTDRELLETYTRERSESAFTELVRRHINVVYSAALRETRGDTGQAEDITQAVFSELARKAPRLRRHPALAGWLYTCVRHVAANTRRAEGRRQRREQEAHNMKDLLSPDSSAAAWREIQPVLDDAMHELNETDRAAVVLRFFEDRSHKEVGQALGLEENAARMRVERALEKLRTLLDKRGITSTASGLTAALAIGAAMSAPSGLAATVATTTLAGGGATLTILGFMSMAKMKTAVIGTVLLAGVGTSLLVQQQASASLRATSEALQQQAKQISGLQSENERLAGVGQENGPSLNTEEELQRLQREAAALRQQTNGYSGLREENARLQASLAGLKQGRTNSGLQVIARERRTAQDTENYVHRLAISMIYKGEHREHLLPGLYPTLFEEAKQTMPASAGGASGINADLFDIVIYKTSQANAVGVPVPQGLPMGPPGSSGFVTTSFMLREKQPRQLSDGSWVRTYAFGQSTMSVKQSDANFDAWEKQRGILPIK